MSVAYASVGTTETRFECPSLQDFFANWVADDMWMLSILPTAFAVLVATWIDRISRVPQRRIRSVAQKVAPSPQRRIAFWSVACLQAAAYSLIALWMMRGFYVERMILVENLARDDPWEPFEEVVGVLFLFVLVLCPVLPFCRAPRSARLGASPQHVLAIVVTQIALALFFTLQHARWVAV